MRSTVITGVSRGLGAALFDEAYGRGDRVLALGRGFSAEQRRLAEERPERVRLRRTDLADPHTLPEAAELREVFGGATLRSGEQPGDSSRAACRSGDQSEVSGAGTREWCLIHNAGVVGPIGAVGALPAADLAAAFAVNLTAPALLTNAFLAAAPSGPRRVVFISSAAADRVIGGWSAYCAGKAGAEMFFGVLAEQFAGDPSVRVACVNPGQLATGMQEEIRAAGRSGAYFPQRQQWEDSFTAGRLQDPARVAREIIERHLS